MSTIAVFFALGGVGWAASQPTPSVELVDVTFTLGTKVALGTTAGLSNTVVPMSLSGLAITRNGVRTDEDGRLYSSTLRDGTISGRVVLNRRLSSCLPLSGRWSGPALSYVPTAVTGGFKPEMLTVNIRANSATAPPVGSYDITWQNLPAWSGTTQGRPAMGANLNYVVTNSFACASNH